jgi:hypothetical protein
MNFDSSNDKVNCCVDRVCDQNREHPVSEQASRSVGNICATGRNWAWAHGNESYDWMDFHSPISRQEPFN